MTDNAATPPALQALDLDDPGRVEAIYLAALGRKPTVEERTELVKYVSSGGPHKDRGKALADVQGLLRAIP